MKSIGFTLAEVLITLGIIGVVAALTIPTLVTRYQKKMTAIKLKNAYATLQQAYRLSVAENGDMDGWGLASHYNEVAGAQGDTELNDFVETYFLPYIKTVKNYGVTSFKSIGYKNIYSMNGSAEVNEYENGSRYIIALADGAIVGIYFGTSPKVDEEGNTIHNYKDVVMLVDLNGFSGPNTIGKDIFYMDIPFQTSVFGFFTDERRVSTAPEKCFSDSERKYVLSACSRTASDKHGTNKNCGRLIQCDGWEINYDW